MVAKSLWPDETKMNTVNRILALLFMMALTVCLMIFLFAMLLVSGPVTNRALVPARRSLQLSKSPPPSKPQLHVFSLSYMDQLSWASRRLKSLQCWSSMWLKRSHDVRVVEPFLLNGAHLGVPTDIQRYRNTTLQFEDIFNLDVWNWGPYPRLVSWEDFLRDGSRLVVAVQIVYREDYRCPESDFTAERCSPHLTQTLAQILPQDFVVLKQVCINFRVNNTLTAGEFNNLILGSVPKQGPITIIFDEWRGMGKNSNIENQCFLRLKNGNECTPNGQEAVGNLTNRVMNPSSKIRLKAKAYISQYLRAKRGYVAVVVRWEKVILHNFYSDRYSKRYTGSNCSHMIMEFVNKAYRKKRMYSTFFATDISKHGSSTFDRYNYTQDSIENITVYTEHLIKTLHHNDSMSLTDYEQRFEEVSGTNNPAFISQMQKVIAANARCLLLVGWGAFHESILKMYRKIHPKVASRCAEVIHMC